MVPVGKLMSNVKVQIIINSYITTATPPEGSADDLQLN